MTQFQSLETVIPLLQPCIVVEDDAIILLDIEHTLRHLGFSDIRTSTTLAIGSKLADAPDIRLALLDFELGRTVTSLALAEALLQRGIPMVFLTAYGADLQLPSSLAHIPIIAKPFTTETLAATLAGLTRVGAAAKSPCVCS